MHIIITSATAMETAQLQQNIHNDILQKHSIEYHISGVGVLCSTYALTDLLIKNKPDLIIQTGIAGTYNGKEDIGKVFVMHSDCLGNTGVWENNEWNDIFDNGFADSFAPPFSDKKLINPWLKKFPVTLPQVNGITVDEITTDTHRIPILKNKYQADTESMEGAPFHYVCLMQHIPFLQIRGISNEVGVRDKSLWKITSALSNVSEEIIRLLKKI